MIHDTWYMIHDTWYMIHDTWYMIHDDNDDDNIYCWTCLIFMLMLMLYLWLQAETPGVTHFGAYHRPPDGHFFLSKISEVYFCKAKQGLHWRLASILCWNGCVSPLGSPATFSGLELVFTFPVLFRSHSKSLWSRQKGFSAGEFYPRHKIQFSSQKLFH